MLVSRSVGRTRVFEFNPRNPTADRLRQFLTAELAALPKTIVEQYFQERRRPRRTAKDLRELKRTGITADSSLEEIATIVSEVLTDAGITAVLGGGGAVTYYSDNRYMSTDLDFITVERNKAIAPVLAELGFTLRGKDFVDDESKFFLEFPPGPLTFGDRYVDTSETVVVQTKYGELRIITPTQCLMDRLAWVVHGKDPAVARPSRLGRTTAGDQLG